MWKRLILKVGFFQEFSNTTMKKLLIIDTFNLLHRAYHALPNSFRDKSGEPVNAVYGVSSMLITLLAKIKPDYVIAALESKTPTFRVENFTAYKAQRKPMEEDLSIQIPKVLEVLDAFGIKQLQVNGYEADDVVGTVTKKYSDKNEVVIISNDRDLWQLAEGNTMVGLPGGKGDVDWVGGKEAEARLGFKPEKIADYKGLRGDPSDNIPGVFGIGEKTATRLIQEFGSVEEIYKNIDKVKPDSLREKLLNCAETAMMSKKLAELILDVPVDVNLDECVYKEFNHGKVKEILEKYNFKSLLRRLGFGVDLEVKKKEEPLKEQLPLF
jgi:DNA polymerase-1